MIQGLLVLLVLAVLELGALIVLEYKSIYKDQPEAPLNPFKREVEDDQSQVLEYTPQDTGEERAFKKVLEEMKK
jgi:hypothetical protein